MIYVPNCNLDVPINLIDDLGDENFKELVSPRSVFYLDFRDWNSPARLGLNKAGYYSCYLATNTHFLLL